MAAPVSRSRALARVAKCPSAPQKSAPRQNLGRGGSAGGSPETDTVRPDDRFRVGRPRLVPIPMSAVQGGQTLFFPAGAGAGADNDLRPRVSARGRPFRGNGHWVTGRGSRLITGLLWSLGPRPSLKPVEPRGVRLVPNHVVHLEAWSRAGGSPDHPGLAGSARPILLHESCYGIDLIPFPPRGRRPPRLSFPLVSCRGVLLVKPFSHLQSNFRSTDLPLFLCFREGPARTSFFFPAAPIEKQTTPFLATHVTRHSTVANPLCAPTIACRRRITTRLP